MSYAVDVDLDSANGPKIVYPRGTDPDDLEWFLPSGWEIDWNTVPATCGSRIARPLRRVDGGGK